MTEKVMNDILMAREMRKLESKWKVFANVKPRDIFFNTDEYKAYPVKPENPRTLCVTLAEDTSLFLQYAKHFLSVSASIAGLTEYDADYMSCGEEHFLQRFAESVASQRRPVLVLAESTAVCGKLSIILKRLQETMKASNDDFFTIDCFFLLMTPESADEALFLSVEQLSKQLTECQFIHEVMRYGISGEIIEKTPPDALETMFAARLMYKYADLEETLKYDNVIKYTLPVERCLALLHGLAATIVEYPEKSDLEMIPILNEFPVIPYLLRTSCDFPSLENEAATWHNTVLAPAVRRAADCRCDYIVCCICSKNDYYTDNVVSIILGVQSKFMLWRLIKTFSPFYNSTASLPYMQPAISAEIVLLSDCTKAQRDELFHSAEGIPVSIERLLMMDIEIYTCIHNKHTDSIDFFEMLLPFLEEPDLEYRYMLDMLNGSVEPCFFCPERAAVYMLAEKERTKTLCNEMYELASGFHYGDEDGFEQNLPLAVKLYEAALSEDYISEASEAASALSEYIDKYKLQQDENYPNIIGKLRAENLAEYETLAEKIKAVRI